jgi:hypothetical protein
MSAIAALKGYRTQFLYSLHYILSHQSKDYVFRLEGKEDLDVLDKDGNLLFAMQVKNLAQTVTLANILTDKKTSFLKRFIEQYSHAVPVLISFGTIAPDIKNWKNNSNTLSSNERATIQKGKFNESQWKLVKSKLELVEVKEDEVLEEILSILKDRFPFIDPIPTADYLLYWLQLIAEKQVLITTLEVFAKIEDFALYISERISVTEQYGIFIKPLHSSGAPTHDYDKLREEFYYGVSARYEHIISDLDITRVSFLDEISHLFTQSNVVVVQGASGQGKSTLAYRFARNYSPESLVYELNIQDDPVNTIKSINAIVSLTKNLSSRVLFIINVNPNSTEWLKIIKEFSSATYLQFLITIRKEDWFRAESIGIEFLHNDIELTLNKFEAEIIYHNLNDRMQILQYADFEEAWISFGENVPLLEFIYSITQGTTLKSRLKQQVVQLSKEDVENGNDLQLQFLRVVSLADSFGARIELSKIRTYPGLQFILEKFESEYLVRQTSDKRFVVGLHPVRSRMLSAILFDNVLFVKKDTILSSITLVEEGDVYAYLLYAFYFELIQPQDVIHILTGLKNLSWRIYNSIRKGLLWAGIRDFVNTNTSLIDRCYEKYGDAWMFIVDVYLGNIIDLDKTLDSFDLGSEIKQLAQELNSQLSDKRAVHQYEVALFNNVPLPAEVPKDSDEWTALGDILFWLAQSPNQASKIENIKRADFKEAFELLNSRALPKLMLGMFYYSKDYNNIRLELVDIFVEKVRREFSIPLLQIQEDVTIDYIVNINDTSNNTAGNSWVVEIIELFRYAFPDKRKYTTQGHGHRLPTLSIAYEETHKSISVENLPLKEWTSLNGTIQRLYEFCKRPKDWVEFIGHLSQWEEGLDAILKNFNETLSSPGKKRDYPKLFSIVNQSNYSTPALKEPQSIVDPLGIAGGMTTINNQAKLSIKYQPFFKAYRGFKTPIENFISQLGKAIIDKLKKLEDPNDLSSEWERLSLVNLFDAIDKSIDYRKRKGIHFGKYLNDPKSEISQNTLMRSAIVWKRFLGPKSSGYNKNIKDGDELVQLRTDFESRISKGCRLTSKNQPFKITYHNDKTTLYRAVFSIRSSNPVTCLIGLREAYEMVKDAIGSPEYTSLKQLMLQTYFSKIYFIHFVEDKVLKSEWHVMPLYVFREHNFDCLALHHVIPKPIDDEIIISLKINPWQEIIPEIGRVQKLKMSFSNITLFAEHIYDLKRFASNEIDDLGFTMVTVHINSVSATIQSSFQSLLDELANILTEFPFSEEGYLSNELEHEYWNAIQEIKANIFPTDKGDEVNYEVKLDIDSIGSWTDRLRKCANSWGFFCLLLEGKYIERYLNLQRDDHQ